MAAGRLVVAVRAVVGYMARGATGAIECRQLAMHIVGKARRVGRRPHDLMAPIALRLRWAAVKSRRLNSSVAHKTLRSGLRRFLFVTHPEALGVERRFHVARVASGRSVRLRLVDVAGLAVIHPELDG